LTELSNLAPLWKYDNQIVINQYIGKK